jgi:hypothetical protein
MTSNLDLQGLTVRRFGDVESTPIMIDPKQVCGLFSDHHRLGCIALAWNDGRGRSGTWHLTTADALRLSDLLRAMADTNASGGDPR